eukprot:jgi/Mesen1/3344/ME000191S02481
MAWEQGESRGGGLETLKIVGSVPRVAYSSIGYEHFFTKYMTANMPVVITGVTDTWRARREWVTADGAPNLEALKALFGCSHVQVADCGEQEFTDQRRLSATLAEFVDYWAARNARLQAATRSAGAERRGGEGQGEGERGGEEEPGEEERGCNGQLAPGGEGAGGHLMPEKLLYLKDWHFVKEFPRYKAYAVPDIFSDDWLNAYCDVHRLHEEPPEPARPASCRDADGKLHTEPSEQPATCHESDSGLCAEPSEPASCHGAHDNATPPTPDSAGEEGFWSANVCGRKRWLLLPPAQMPLLRHRHRGETVYDINAPVSAQDFPVFSQERGDALFVPSGWYHQVANLSPLRTPAALALMPSSFLLTTWHLLPLAWYRLLLALLQADYASAVAEIEDIREISGADFERLAQRNLAANSGANFADFLRFVAAMTAACADVALHAAATCPGLRRSTAGLLERAERILGLVSDSGLRAGPTARASAAVKLPLGKPRSLGQVRHSLERVGEVLTRMAVPVTHQCAPESASGSGSERDRWRREAARPTGEPAEPRQERIGSTEGVESVASGGREAHRQGGRGSDGSSSTSVDMRGVKSGVALEPLGGDINGGDGLSPWEADMGAALEQLDGAIDGGEGLSAHAIAELAGVGLLALLRAVE